MSIILGITGTLAEGYWTSPLYLFNNGTWSNLQTTGMTATSNADYSGIENNALKIKVYSNSGSTIVGLCRLNQVVNISSYNYLKAYCKSTTLSIAGIGISTSASAARSNLVAYTEFGAGATGIINISSFSGNYYIYVTARHTSNSMNSVVVYVSTLFLSNS